MSACLTTAIDCRRHISCMASIVLPEFSAGRPSASCRMVAAYPSSELAFCESPSPTSDHTSGEVVGQSPPITADENGRAGIIDGAPTLTTGAHPDHRRLHMVPQAPPDCHSRRPYQHRW